MAQVDGNIDRIDFVEETIIFLQLCFYQFLVSHKVLVTEFFYDELKQVLCKSRIIRFFFIGLTESVVSLIDCESNFDVVLEFVQLKYLCHALIVNCSIAMMMVSTIIFVVRVQFIQNYRYPAGSLFICNRQNPCLNRGNSIL